MRYIIYICMVLAVASTAAGKTTYNQIIAMHEEGQSVKQMMTWCENLKSTEALIFQEIRSLANDDFPLEFINCLLQKAVQNPDSGIIKYENESFLLSENIRGYFKQEHGHLKLVITNLDQHGSRLGGEIPFEEQLAQKRYFEERYAREAREAQEAENYREPYEQPPLVQPPEQSMTAYEYVPPYQIIDIRPIYPYGNYHHGHSHDNSPQDNPTPVPQGPGRPNLPPPPHNPPNPPHPTPAKPEPGILVIHFLFKEQMMELQEAIFSEWRHLC